MKLIVGLVQVTNCNVETTVSNIPFASNDEIELEADLIVDFSERNPFGEV